MNRAWAETEFMDYSDSANQSIIWFHPNSEYLQILTLPWVGVGQIYLINYCSSGKMEINYVSKKTRDISEIREKLSRW